MVQWTNLQGIRKSDGIVHNLWKIWRPAPSGTGSYSRQADEIWARFEILKVCCRSKYIFDFTFCLTKVLHCFNIFDAFLTFFFRQTLLQGCFIALWFHINPYYSSLIQQLINVHSCSSMCAGAKTAWTTIVCHYNFWWL